MAVLTLIADYPACPLADTILHDLQGTFTLPPPKILSPGEAVAFSAPVLPDLGAVRALLEGSRIDAVLTPDGNRRKALLVADMDGTVISDETIDRLAARAGCEAEVAAITAAGMNGEIDFAEGLRRRVAMLAGLPEAAIEETWRSLAIRPGAAALVATMRAHGAASALVTSGFACFASRLATQLGFDAFRANTLIVEDGVLAGRVAEPILDRFGKLAALRALAAARGVTPADALAVGDGANDLPMLLAAGLGVAFHAKPIVAAQVAARIDACGLRALLFLQGYTAREIARAGR